jgi:acetolactate synthase I/II/III large subunit
MASVVDTIVDELSNIGITTYFIVTGGAIVPFVDAVGRSSKTKHYCFQHEQAASMAAEGYYRASGKVPAVLVTSGPGVQNILNGVCGSWYDSIPVICISGQVNFNESLDSIKSSPRQVGFQEFPVESTFASCTKYSKKILKIEDIQPVFTTAIDRMLTGRKGPVLIDFPVNLQMSKIDHFLLSLPSPIETSSCLDISSSLSSSSRPLIVVGNGCRDYTTQLRSWIQQTGIPFVTSWAACDLIDHSDPLRIGYIGVYGDRVANLALQNADLLLILGSRIDTRQIGGNLKTCSTQSKKIMVDIDLNEILKFSERGFNIDIPIHASVGSFLNSNPAVSHSCSDWKTTIAGWKTTLEIEPNRVPGDIYDILKQIVLPEECIIIPDTGGNLVWTLQSITLGPKQKLFTNFGNSSMGYALPASIGAAIATESKIPILCICGDGGIQMNVQEFQTLSSLNLPVTVLIINNSGYGIIRQFQDQYFNSRYTATSSEEVFGESTVDIVKIANAYGIEGTITKREIQVWNKPFVYDLQIEATQKIYPKLEFGNALENMSPYFPQIESMMITPYTQPNSGKGWVSK